MRPPRGPELVALAFLVAACGSAAAQGTDYLPPNDLPIGEPTDRSGEGDAGRMGDAASDADARTDAAFDGGR